MHATIDVRFELSIDDDKTLPLATLAEAVTDQNLEAVLLESLVESPTPPASRRSVVRNTHMATVTSASNAPAPTPAQLSQLPENTSSLSTTSKIQPLPQTNPVISGPSKTFSTSTGRTAISRTSPPKRRSATSLSYRDAANHGDSFVSMPSPTTINRRAKKYGHKLKQFLPDCVAGTDADAVIPDGTKCHSQDDDRSSHSVQATLGEDTAEESRSLLDLSVNADWDETAAELDDIGAVTDDATVVSDADSGIVTAFTDENRDHQLDLVHVGRTLGYTLWDDGVFSLDRRKEIVSEVIDEVFHLKNSVAKHRPAEEFAAIRSRIARTRERLEKTAWQLEQFGSAKAAGYLRRWLPSIVTFAEHAVEGFEVPWTSNPVERLMGEVSKRCKNQWMRWTAEGLEAILQLRLVKYADPEYYQAFLDELLQRSTKTAINCDLSIESTSGKV